MTEAKNRRQPGIYWGIGGTIGILVAAASGLEFARVVVPLASLGCLLGYIVFLTLRTLDETLIRAARRGDLDRVRALLGEGRNVNIKNQNGDTALIRACSRGHSDVVRALLSAGADVNAKSDRGYTPLMIASSRGSLGLVQALLEKGADANAKSNKGETALSMAKDMDIKAPLNTAGNRDSVEHWPFCAAKVTRGAKRCPSCLEEWA